MKTNEVVRCGEKTIIWKEESPSVSTRGLSGTPTLQGLGLGSQSKDVCWWSHVVGRTRLVSVGVLITILLIICSRDLHVRDSRIEMTQCLFSPHLFSSFCQTTDYKSTSVKRSPIGLPSLWDFVNTVYVAYSI